jgi:hypothetical protein
LQAIASDARGAKYRVELIIASDSPQSAKASTGRSTWGREAVGESRWRESLERAG